VSGALGSRNNFPRADPRRTPVPPPKVVSGAYLPEKKEGHSRRVKQEKNNSLGEMG